MINKDEKLLNILKSNIIDYEVHYGNDREAYNTATITIEVKQPKDFIDIIDGEEVYCTPCVSIDNDDFELIIDMLSNLNIN